MHIELHFDNGHLVEELVGHKVGLVGSPVVIDTVLVAHMAVVVVELVPDNPGAVVHMALEHIAVAEHTVVAVEHTAEVVVRAFDLIALGNHCHPGWDNHFSDFSSL